MRGGDGSRIRAWRGGRRVVGVGVSAFARTGSQSLSSSPRDHPGVARCPTAGAVEASRLRRSSRRGRRGRDDPSASPLASEGDRPKRRRLLRMAPRSSPIGSHSRLDAGHVSLEGRNHIAHTAALAGWNVTFSPSSPGTSASPPPRPPRARTDDVLTSCLPSSTVPQIATASSGESDGRGDDANRVRPSARKRENVELASAAAAWHGVRRITECQAEPATEACARDLRGWRRRRRQARASARPCEAGKCSTAN